LEDDEYVKTTKCRVGMGCKYIIGAYGGNNYWRDAEDHVVAREPSPLFFLMPPPPNKTAAIIDRLYDMRRPLNMFDNPQWTPLLDYYGEHLYMLLCHQVRWALERALVTVLNPVKYKLNVSVRPRLRGFVLDLYVCFHKEPSRRTSARVRFIRGLRNWLCSWLSPHDVEGLMGNVEIFMMANWYDPPLWKDVVCCRRGYVGQGHWGRV